MVGKKSEGKGILEFRCPDCGTVSQFPGDFDGKPYCGRCVDAPAAGVEERKSGDRGSSREGRR